MKQIRMTALAVAALSLGLLTACEPPAPAATGVGFGDYETYLANRGPQAAARQAQLTGQTPSGQVGGAEATGAPQAGQPGVNPVSGVTATDLAAAGIGVTATQTTVPTPQSVARVASADPGAPLAAPGVATSGLGAAPAPVAPTATASLPAPAPAPAPVAGEQVIQRAEASAPAVSNPSFTSAPVVAQQPAPAPAASGVASVSSGPDIVAFALSTSHPVGTQMYPRGVLSRAQSGRTCARYHGGDQAQRAFLEAGGPYRDRFGLDPDGDGFACGWSPEPFRAAVRG